MYFVFCRSKNILLKTGQSNENFTPPTGPQAELERYTVLYCLEFIDSKMCIMYAQDIRTYNPHKKYIQYTFSVTTNGHNSTSHVYV